MTMNKGEILSEIQSIFRKELDDEGLEITYDSSPDSVEKWDSINNLVLISAIEDHFNLNFSTDAIFSIHTIDDIILYIEKNLIV
jgi:acyl carrier protein